MDFMVNDGGIIVIEFLCKGTHFENTLLFTYSVYLYVFI